MGKGAGHYEIGRKTHHEHDHKGTQVAAAQPGKRAVATIPAQRHAVAKHQAADNCADRVPDAVNVSGFGTVHPARRYCQMGADDRDTNRDAPHAQAAVVTAIERVFNRTERAKPADACGQSKGNAADQTDERSRIRFS